MKGTSQSQHERSALRGMHTENSRSTCRIECFEDLWSVFVSESSLTGATRADLCTPLDTRLDRRISSCRAVLVLFSAGAPWRWRLSKGAQNVGWWDDAWAANEKGVLTDITYTYIYIHIHSIYIYVYDRYDIYIVYMYIIVYIYTHISSHKYNNIDIMRSYWMFAHFWAIQTTEAVQDEVAVGSWTNCRRWL